MAAETTTVAPAAVRRMSGLREFWYYFSMNHGAVLGLLVFVLLILVAIFAPLLAPCARSPR